MTDLHHVAALARALERHVVIWRDVLDRDEEGNWHVVQSFYRGWYSAKCVHSDHQEESPDVPT